jgi:hypothetical protein
MQAQSRRRVSGLGVADKLNGAMVNAARQIVTDQPYSMAAMEIFLNL